jgi:hypothetical protein
VVVGFEPADIESGSFWENGNCEDFKAHFRNAMLDGEVSCSLRNAQILIEQ